LLVEQRFVLGIEPGAQHLDGRNRFLALEEGQVDDAIVRERWIESDIEQAAMAQVQHGRRA
jgi:hypothetical protein